jgi:hypothetical protein
MVAPTEVLAGGPGGGNACLPVKPGDYNFAHV